MADQTKHLTRRSVLHLSWCGLATAGAASSILSKVAKLNRKHVGNVTEEDFLPYVGKKLTFRGLPSGLDLAPAGATLILARVTSHGSIRKVEARNPAKYGKRKRESFSLLFELQDGEPLGSGLHQLAHPDFEGFHLFLSPISQPKSNRSMLYEAVFG